MCLFAQFPHFKIFRLRLALNSLSDQFEAITVGDAVKGLLRPTDSDYKSANLLGWTPTSFHERSAASPRSFFDDGLQLDHEALRMLPLLGYKYLHPRRGRSSQLLFQNDKQRLVAADALLPPPTGHRNPKPKNGATPKADPPTAPKAPAKPLMAKPRITFGQLLDRFGMLRVPLKDPDSLLRSYRPFPPILNL